MITNADICRSLHAYQFTRVVSEGGIMCLKGEREGGRELYCISLALLLACVVSCFCTS